MRNILAHEWYCKVEMVKKSLYKTDTSLLSVHDERGEESELHWRITRYDEVEQSTLLSTVGLVSVPNLQQLHHNYNVQ